MKGICAPKKPTIAIIINNLIISPQKWSAICRVRDMKLYIISNRLPVKVSEKNGTFSFTRSEGGLATGLDSLQTDRGKIGRTKLSPRIPVRHPDKKLLRRLQQQYHLAAVPLFLCLYIVQGHFLASLPRSKQAIL